MAVLKLKDGRIVVAYRKGVNPEDPERTREYFGRGPSARKAAEARDAQLKLGQRKKMAPRRPMPKFKDIAALYMEARAAHNTPSTNEGRYHKFKGVILPELGHLPVDRLTHRRLDQYVNKRLKTQRTVWTGPEDRRRKKKLFDAGGKPKLVKAVTVHRELSDIMAVMAWAKDNNRIAINRVAGYKKLPRDDERIRPPSPAEARRLIDNAPQHLVRAITIAWYTGTRPGSVELFRLRWADVDFERNCLFVIGARKGGPVTRSVPFDAPFAATLQQWYTDDGKDDARHIITYHGQPVTTIKTAWKNAKAKAKIRRRLRPYDLRHAFVSYLLDGEGDLKSVSSMAGHSRTETTTRIYQHLSMDLLRRTVRKMPAIAEEAPTDATD